MARRLRAGVTGTGGQLRIAIALTLVVGASALFWISRDRAVAAPDWDGQVRGIAYNPGQLIAYRAPTQQCQHRAD